MIYLDNAATTQVSEKAVRAMLPYMNCKYGNPSSIYELAEHSKHAIEHARKQVAQVIGAKEKEIYFTSGGSESDNWALMAVMLDPKAKGRHLITSKIEHPAILKTCSYLEERGIDVTYLDIDEQGFIRLEQLERAIRPDTACISIMTANNEIGTIQPIYEIGQIAKRHKLIFHTDAVQAFGHIPISVKECNIHLLSASAHKLHGPKGVGCLYVQEGLELSPLIRGGGQESEKRAGTENVPGIVGFGVAAEEARKHMFENSRATMRLRNYLMKRILWEIPYVRINGSTKMRLPNNVNFSFQFINGESLLILLDSEGICASAASACHTGSAKPSHVLMALGLPEELAYASLRLTLSADNTKEEMDMAIERIKENVEKLREMSPDFADFSCEQGKNGLSYK